jgi:hypothetical protein
MPNPITSVASKTDLATLTAAAIGDLVYLTGPAGGMFELTNLSDLAAAGIETKASIVVWFHDDALPQDGETIKIGLANEMANAYTITFRTANAVAANQEVLIGATPLATANNLRSYINNDWSVASGRSVNVFGNGRFLTLKTLASQTANSQIKLDRSSNRIWFASGRPPLLRGVDPAKGMIVQVTGTERAWVRKASQIEPRFFGIPDRPGAAFVDYDAAWQSMFDLSQGMRLPVVLSPNAEYQIERAPRVTSYSTLIGNGATIHNIAPLPDALTGAGGRPSDNAALWVGNLSPHHFNPEFVTTWGEGVKQFDLLNVAKGSRTLKFTSAMAAQAIAHFTGKKTAILRSGDSYTDPDNENVRMYRYVQIVEIVSVGTDGVEILHPVSEAVSASSAGEIPALFTFEGCGVQDIRADGYELYVCHKAIIRDVNLRTATGPILARGGTLGCSIHVINGDGREGVFLNTFCESSVHVENLRTKMKGIELAGACHHSSYRVENMFYDYELGLSERDPNGPTGEILLPVLKIGEHSRDCSMHVKRLIANDYTEGRMLNVLSSRRCRIDLDYVEADQAKRDLIYFGKAASDHDLTLGTIKAGAGVTNIVGLDSSATTETRNIRVHGQDPVAFFANRAITNTSLSHNTNDAVEAFALAVPPGLLGDGDGVEVSVLLSLEGTAGSKTVEIRDQLGTLHSHTFAATVLGEQRLVFRITRQNNGRVLSEEEVGGETVASAYTVTSQSGRNLDLAGLQLSVRIFVANPSDGFRAQLIRATSLPAKMLA